MFHFHIFFLGANDMDDTLSWDSYDGFDDYLKNETEEIMELLRAKNEKIAKVSV